MLGLTALRSRLQGWDIAGGSPDAPIRAAIFTEHLNATYYISFHFVLEKLARERQVYFCVLSQESVQRRWPDAARLAGKVCERIRPDVAVFSRYGHPLGAELLLEFRRRGVATIYHIDDDLLEIPASLGQAVQRSHGAAEVVEARRAMLGAADLIYASTPRLATALRGRFPRSSVTHGGVYASYAAMLKPPGRTSADRPGVTIGYMGSKSHAQDLELAVPALNEILRQHPQARFEVFGTVGMPPGIAAAPGRLARHEALTDYRGFVDRLCRLGWDVGLAPLEDNRFNACKAPTKFVEYTLGDIPTVASDVPVYSEVIGGGNGMLARSTEQWLEAMDTLVRSPERRQSMLESARRTCAERFSFDALCRQVLEVLALARQSRPAGDRA